MSYRKHSQTSGGTGINSDKWAGSKDNFSLWFSGFLSPFLSFSDIDMREKHGSVASRKPLTRDLAQNQGMCSDQESNWWPFGLLDNSQPTEPHQLGILSLFLLPSSALAPSPLPPPTHGSSSLLSFSVYSGPLLVHSPDGTWLPVAPGSVFIPNNQQELSCVIVPSCRLSS